MATAMMDSLGNSFSPHAKDEEEAQAESYITKKLRNRVVDRAVKNFKVKARFIRDRGTLQVPAPYANEEPEELYPYAAMHSFDRRAFLVELDEAMARRVSGDKESAIVSASLDSAEAIMAEFKRMDSSGDGTLTREEVVRNSSLLNMSVEEAHRLFDRLDTNNSGEVDQVYTRVLFLLPSLRFQL
jgi:hypothetical protein